MLRDAVGDMPHLVTCIEVPCMFAADKAKAAAEASGEKLVSALVDAVDSQVSKVRNKAFSAYRTFWPVLLEQFVSIVCADNKHSIVFCSPHLHHKSAPLQAFQQEKDLSREAKEARVLASKFRDQTADWVSAAQRADKVLRDYGDYETYLQTIVNDMTEVQSMLQELAQLKIAKATSHK